MRDIRWLWAACAGLGILGLIGMHPPESVDADAAPDQEALTVSMDGGTDHDGAVQSLQAIQSHGGEPEAGEQEILEFPGSGSEVELDFGTESEVEEVSGETELLDESGGKD